MRIKTTPMRCFFWPQEPARLPVNQRAGKREDVNHAAEYILTGLHKEAEKADPSPVFHRGSPGAHRFKTAASRWRVPYHLRIQNSYRSSMPRVRAHQERHQPVTSSFCAVIPAPPSGDGSIPHVYFSHSLWLHPRKDKDCR